MRIVVLAGGIGGARFLLGVRAVAREHRRRRDGRGQRRRRRDRARAARLPGSRQCDVYAGRRRRPRARLGPRRRVLGGQGRAGGLRGRADLVRARRQGRGHPPGAHPAAAPGPAADRGHRAALPALATGDPPAAGHRRPARDPRGRRGRRRDARAALPGMVDPLPRGRADEAVRDGRAPSRPRRPTAVRTALDEADIVLVAPSNPVVSIGPILAVSDLRARLVEGKAPVIGVSPIIGGAPVRGMADRCLEVAGVDCTAAAVGGAARRAGRGRHPRRLAGRRVDAGAAVARRSRCDIVHCG